jgi:hypothetical protein
MVAMVRRPFLAAGCLMAFVLCASPRAQAQEQAGEYEVKAAFLYNFGKFVQWPAGAFKGQYDPIVLGIVGQDPFEGALDAIAQDKVIQGRRMVVKRFKTAKEITACHILFVSKSEAANLGPIVEATRKLSVLTVSDIPGFSDNGGAIGLFLEGRKVRFDVNLDVIEHAGLKMSSQVLRIAKGVRN